MRCLLLHDSKACIRVSEADRGLVNELVVGMGSRFDKAARSRPAGARFGAGRMVVLWPNQDARKTRPMKCPEAGR
jgi:hypothetical protein